MGQCIYFSTNEEVCGTVVASFEDAMAANTTVDLISVETIDSEKLQWQQCAILAKVSLGSGESRPRRSAYRARDLVDVF